MGGWSARQYVQFLEQAVATLDAPDPPFPFRLSGKDFVHCDGARVRLGSQVAALLQLLADNAGRPVTLAMLKAVGVGNPPKAKNRLLKRLREAGIELRVAASPGASTLLPSDP